MLADSPEERPVPMMLASGCAIGALRRLVRDQLATAARERAPRARTITVVRLRITDAGRCKLASLSASFRSMPSRGDEPK
jgi:hypothetical protein